MSSDNLNEQASQLKEKVNEVNWVVSALLTSLETLQDDTIITDSNEEDAKENITGITSLIDENLSDLYDDENSSALVDQFNKTLASFTINHFPVVFNSVSCAFSERFQN